MLSWLDSEELINAHKNREHLFIPDAVPIDDEWPDWNNFVNIVNAQEVDVPWLSHGKMPGIRDERHHNKYFPRGAIGTATLRPDIEPTSRRFCQISEELTKRFPGRYNLPTAHLYGSITKNAANLGIHWDGSDVLFIQIVGDVRLRLYQPDRETVIADYIMGPSDAVFIPAKMHHFFEPLTPRFSYSLGME